MKMIKYKWCIFIWFGICCNKKLLDNLYIFIIYVYMLKKYFCVLFDNFVSLKKIIEYR